MVLIKCYLRKSSFNIFLFYITKSIRSCAARQINMQCVISGCCSVGSKDGRQQVKYSDHVPISINTTKELHVILNCFRNVSNMVKFCEMSVFYIAIFLSLLGYSGESMYRIKYFCPILSVLLHFIFIIFNSIRIKLFMLICSYCFEHVI